VLLVTEGSLLSGDLKSANLIINLDAFRSRQSLSSYSNLFGFDFKYNYYLTYI